MFALQGKQDEPERYWPAEHETGVQLEAPPPDVVPDGQFVHEEAPAFEKVPAGQLTHELKTWPCAHVLEYCDAVPAVHSVHVYQWDEPEQVQLLPCHAEASAAKASSARQRADARPKAAPPDRGILVTFFGRVFSRVFIEAAAIITAVDERGCAAAEGSPPVFTETDLGPMCPPLLEVNSVQTLLPPSSGLRR